jgi:hypothetical protein
MTGPGAGRSPRCRFPIVSLCLPSRGCGRAQQQPVPSMRDQNPEEAAATRLAAPGLDFQTLHEIVAKARQNLNQNDWDYIVGAAETETTLRRNRLALDQIAFRPRVLRDVSRIDATVQQFGRRLRLPLVFAPVGALESFNEMAAAAVVRAAREFGIAHMLSSVCAPGLEKVAAAAPDAARTTSRSIARHLRQLRHSAPSG